MYSHLVMFTPHSDRPSQQLGGASSCALWMLHGGCARLQTLGGSAKGCVYPTLGYMQCGAL